MNIIEVIQGSEEWKAVRAKHFCASEAAAMLGFSKFMSRSELLNQKYTGIAPEVDANKQRLFDAGHASEAAARPIVEARINDELYPITCTLDVEGMPLLASLDGINLSGERIWENKLYNASLETAIIEGELSDHYWPQLEQGLLVSGADTCYFTTSDGTEKATIGIWYDSIPARRAQLIAGWRQFSYDLANYTHIEHAEKPKAEAVMSLPALSVQATGMVTRSNLPEFKAAAESYIASINTDLQTDQHFADAEATVKFCKATEEKLEVTKSAILAQTASIDEVIRTVTYIQEQLSKKRLVLKKLVESEKEARKREIITAAQNEIAEHVASLEKETSPIRLFPSGQKPDFAGAIYGKKSLASMRGAVNDALANSKIAADAVAKDIRAKLAWFSYVMAIEQNIYRGLFHDLQSLSAKPLEDFKLAVDHRVSVQKQAEANKLEAERARIQAQEEAKAKAAQDALLATERAKMEAEVRTKAELDALEFGARILENQAAAAIEERRENATPKQESTLATNSHNKSPSPIARQEAAQPSTKELTEHIAQHYGVSYGAACDWIMDAAETMRRAA